MRRQLEAGGEVQGLQRPGSAPEDQRDGGVQRAEEIERSAKASAERYDGSPRSPAAGRRASSSSDVAARSASQPWTRECVAQISRSASRAPRFVKSEDE